MTRPCLEPRCANPGTYRGRCATHARTRQRTINRAGTRIYNSKRWKRTRDRILTDHPLCECGRIATDVHHIVDLADGGDPYAIENIEVLCHACHSRRTRRGQIAR